MGTSGQGSGWSLFSRVLKSLNFKNLHSNYHHVWITLVTLTTSKDCLIRSSPSRYFLFNSYRIKLPFSGQCCSSALGSLELKPWSFLEHLRRSAAGLATNLIFSQMCGISHNAVKLMMFLPGKEHRSRNPKTALLIQTPEEGLL